MSMAMPSCAQRLRRRRADRRHDRAAEAGADAVGRGPAGRPPASRCTTCVAVVSSTTSTPPSASARHACAQRLQVLRQRPLVDRHARHAARRALRAPASSSGLGAPYSCTATRSPRSGISVARWSSAASSSRQVFGSGACTHGVQAELAQHGRGLGPRAAIGMRPSAATKASRCAAHAVHELEQRAGADAGQQHDEVELAAHRARRQTPAPRRWIRAAPRASTGATIGRPPYDSTIDASSRARRLSSTSTRQAVETGMAHANDLSSRAGRAAVEPSSEPEPASPAAEGLTSAATAFGVQVGLFAVLRDVEAGALVRRVGAERHHQADDLQQDEADDAAVDDGRQRRPPPGCPAGRGCRTSAPSNRPLSAFSAKTPVSSAPTVPPTPCAATTSSESSSDVLARMIEREVARNRGDRAEDEARSSG